MLSGKDLRNQDWRARLKIVSACGGTVWERRVSVKRIEAESGLLQYVGE